MHPRVRDVLADARPESHACPAKGARFLMCPPLHYAVSYSINPWMNPARWKSGGSALHEEAEQQWLGLQDALLALGAAIEFVDPEPGLPDLVFTANAAVILDGKALLARFRHPERQSEQPVFGGTLDALKQQAEIDTIMEMPDGVWLEGAGDCIWDSARRHFWMGFGPRSHLEAAYVVEDSFDAECVALELADPSFYHLDTAFCPLPSGDVIYYPVAFAESGLRAIEERVMPQHRVAIDRDDAMRFAANAVPLNGSIVLSSCSERLRRSLEERGFAVIATPLHAFLRGGGSACCLTLRLNLRSSGAVWSTH
jgi:N-dimethylarginine dimethylaminohydrolase